MTNHITPPRDLANELIRETWRNPKRSLLKTASGRDPAGIRRAVANAKRFMLDDSMAAFMAELSTVPFTVASERRPDVLDSLRHSARLPFPSLFIQFSNRAFRRRLDDIGGKVRAHWRINHPPLGARFCASRSDHLWLEADDTGHANCRQCDARRVWITLPSGRGDPTISVRTHKYVLTHGDD